MMTNTVVPLQEITASALHLLCREMGVVNTMRFLNQFTTGYGNYTEEREQLFGQMSVEEITTEIKRLREQQANHE
jgi:hypothetical protein